MSESSVAMYSRQQAYTNKHSRELAQKFEKDMAKENNLFSKLLEEPSHVFDNKKLKQTMKNYREKTDQLLRKNLGPRAGAILGNQRPTLDSKPDGNCQHILIKAFTQDGTCQFSSIQTGFDDVTKVNPSLIDFHLLIRGRDPHICINCSLKLLIATNHFKSTFDWMMKYKTTFDWMLKQRPLKVTNDLINLFEISNLILQTWSHIKIIKLSFCNESIFKRMFMMLHFIADYWVKIACLDLNVFELQNTDLNNQFNVRIDAHLQCQEFFLEMFYGSFLQKIKLFKRDQVKWYLELGKNGSYFEKYGLDHGDATASQYEYKHNMYTVFRKLLIRKCCEFPRLLCSNMRISVKSIEFQGILYQNKCGWLMVDPYRMLRRQNRCFYIHYVSWKCNNVKCNITYFEHVYGYRYDELLDHRNKYGIVDKRLKTNNKWYLCKGCRLVSYCSRQCQKYDWNKAHRQSCQKLKSICCK
eukprot:460149_1